MRLLSLTRKRHHFALCGGLFLGLATPGLEAQEARTGTFRLASHCAAGPVGCYAPPPAVYPPRPFRILDEETFGQEGPNFSTRGDRDEDTGVLEIHNQVNITAGVALEIRQNTTFTFAYVAPVAGPSPFDHELQFQLQIFGGGARGPLGFGIY